MAIATNSSNPTTIDRPSRLRTDTLASSVLILIVVTVVQRSVGFGRGILFCRWLSPDTLGQWELAYSFLLLAAPLAVLGVPGSFGRYLEHFRQRGHLHTFLRRTSTWTISCSAAAVGAIWWFAPWFSHLVFGNDENVALMRGIGLCLAAIIYHHTLTSLLTALRLFRVVSAMNFAQSLLFAGLALGLVSFDATVSSVLIGYGSACVLASTGATWWVWPALSAEDAPTENLAQRSFWPLLMRFAFFVWLTNLLTHLFSIVDRYMLMHHSGMTYLEAQTQIGHYHSSRIVPLLIISFADLLSGLIMPHLSSDWEAGRREQVGNQLRMSIKITAIGMLAFGVAVLLFAPFLFDVILEGKYSNGLTVMPWTMAGCVWYGVYALAQNYLWCAEKTRLATLPIAIGLVLNVSLNLLLLPIWGLYGAVAATAISSLVCLLANLLLSGRYGLPLDRGVWLTVLAPLSLPAGPVVAGCVLLSLVIAGLRSQVILSESEREQLQALRDQLVKKVKPWWNGRSSVASNV